MNFFWPACMTADAFQSMLMLAEQVEGEFAVLDHLLYQVACIPQAKCRQ